MHAYHVAIEDLNQVEEELRYFSDWNQLGLKLGLHPDLLLMIGQDPTKQSLAERVEEVLRKWLKRECMDSQKEPTWSQLVNALDPIDRALSIKSKKKYLN